MSRGKEEEPLSPGAKWMRTPGSHIYILAMMGFKTSIDVDLFKKEITRTLARHPRFSSVLVEKNKKRGMFSWKRTEVDLEQHVTVPDLDPDMKNPDKFVDDYLSDLSKNHLSLEKPLWEVHILNVKTSLANSTVIWKIDHSVGDGASLNALILSSNSKKNSIPESLPIIETQEHKKIARVGLPKRLFAYIWTLLLIIFNTLMDCIMLVSTALFLKDSKTLIEAEPGVELSPKLFAHRIISLSDVKFVKNAMNVSINDTLLGVIEAGLTRYQFTMNGKQNENSTAEIMNTSLKNLRIRSVCFFNLRPPLKPEDLAEMMEKENTKKGTWGNKIGISILPLTIAVEDDPLTHVRRAKATMDRLKLSLGHKFGFAVMKLLMFIFGIEGGNFMTRIVKNTTLTFSNVVGPKEEINVLGHPLAYIAPSLFGYSQGLVIHFQSYADKLAIVIGADEKLIPNPGQLCDDLVNSFTAIKEAVLKRGA